MKNSLKALVVVAILAIAGLASAQNSATATATGNATIVCPLTLTNNSNLEFGTITNSTTSGATVTVNADATSNTAVYTGGCAQTPGSTSTHAAKFTATGQVGLTFNTAQSPAFTDFTAGGDVQLSNITFSNNTSSTGFACPSVQACSCGQNVFYVGGKITLTAAAHGAYTAQIPVTIQYN